jgi:hypothetical protein
MALRIKNPETHRLAAELAKRKGTTMTQVITDVLRKELEAAEREAEAQRRARRAMKIAREIRVRIDPENLPDFDALLYDSETGLPK